MITGELWMPAGGDPKRLEPYLSADPLYGIPGLLVTGRDSPLNFGRSVSLSWIAPRYDRHGAASSQGVPVCVATLLFPGVPGRSARSGSRHELGPDG